MDNTGIQVFNFHKNDVRVLIDGHGDPWWVANDICTILELGNPRSSLALLDEDEKGVHVIDTPGGLQNMTTVNEAGLYSLIFRSRKEEAKAFKRWISHDVLPSIRKKGGYWLERDGVSSLTRQAELLLAECRRMDELSAKQAEHEIRIDALETVVSCLPDPNYKTVIGYANEIFKSVTLGEARRLGKLCANASRNLGYAVIDVPHPTYGTVHAYHVDILASVMEDLSNGRL